MPWRLGSETEIGDAGALGELARTRAEFERALVLRAVAAGQRRDRVIRHREGHAGLADRMAAPLQIGNDDAHGEVVQEVSIDEQQFLA
jgi:hypothetical protein